MSTICIYIVEDEPSIAQTVQFTLEAEGFSIQHFSTGNSCVTALADNHPSLILLDIGLADGSGFDFFRKIRELTDAPIIYMTARGNEIDRVVGLEMGADDYIVKPFSLRELVARIRVVLRRTSTALTNTGSTHIASTYTAPVDVSSSGNNTASMTSPSLQPSDSLENANTIFSIDTKRKKILFHNTALDLTLHEYKLLEVLVNAPEQVFSRSQLLEHGWEAPDHRLERTIDSHIKSLRNKLRQVDPGANPICTHRGIGYSLVLNS